MIHLFTVEVNLHPVDVGDTLGSIAFLYLFQYLLYQRAVGEFDAVLGYHVLRQAGAYLGHLLAGTDQGTQEKSRTDEGVAAVVQVGHDDTAVALATDNGTGALHLGGHIDLTHSRSGVGAAVSLSHVAQGTGRGEIRYCRTGLEREHVIGHGHQGVLLPEERAVLADQGQTVHVRIHGDTQVGLLGSHAGAQVHKVRGQRLRIVCELPGRLAVESDALHSESLQQPGHHDAAHRVDRIQHHLEAVCADTLRIHQRMSQDSLHVRVGKVLLHVRAQRIHIAVREAFAVGYLNQFRTLGGIEELPVLIEQLEGIPLLGIVRSRQDDTSVGLLEDHGHLHSRSGGQTGVDHVYAAGSQGSADYLVHHGARDTGITSHHHLEAAVTLAAVQHGAVC